MGHAALGRIGGHRAMQATFAAPVAGTEALEELTFQQLLDLQDEASEDDSFDTFNDVARELKTRRDEAKSALTRLFVKACEQDLTVPMTSAWTVFEMPIRSYLSEAMNTNSGTEQAIRLLLSPADREEIVGALAAEYANEQSEDLLRAGWLA
jgi:hypothetical protein